MNVSYTHLFTCLDLLSCILDMSPSIMSIWMICFCLLYRKFFFGSFLFCSFHIFFFHFRFYFILLLSICRSTSQHPSHLPKSLNNWHYILFNIKLMFLVLVSAYSCSSLIRFQSSLRHTAKTLFGSQYFVLFPGIVAAF